MVSSESNSNTVPMECPFDATVCPQLLLILVTLLEKKVSLPLFSYR